MHYEVMHYEDVGCITLPRAGPWTSFVDAWWMNGECISRPKYFHSASDLIGLIRYSPVDSNTPSTPARHQRNIATTTNSSPVISEALGTSASFNDAPYVMEDGDSEDEDEEVLVREFDRDGAQGAEDLLGFGKDGLDDDAEEDEWNLADDGKSAAPCLAIPRADLGPLDHFKKFQTDTRVAAAVRSEGNRRRGGVKTQKSTVKIWNVSLPFHCLDVDFTPTYSSSQLFLTKEKASGGVHDDIVNEHSLLQFIAWSSNRPKLNRWGEYISGT